MIAKIKYTNAFAATSLSLLSNISYAALDPSAKTIHLRKDCNNYVNCSSQPGEVSDWINLRRTNKQGYAVINIGPGQFNMDDTKLLCDNASNLSFIGSGREITVLMGGGTNIIEGNKSSVISFQSLSVRSDSWVNGNGTGSATGIEWTGSGKSTWSNIDVQASYTGWHDDSGLHYWYGSKLATETSGVTNSVAYYSQGGESWFYGGELETIHNNPGSIINANAVLINGGDFRTFGAALRLTGKANAGSVSAAFGMVGIGVLSDGQVHIHGGIVAVNAKQMAINQDTYGIRAYAGQLIHTPGTAFVITAGGTGNAIRVEGTGTQSPYLWPTGSNPPAIISENGQDVFVETDCSNDGNCNASSGEKHPHIMVFDDTCGTEGTWFNSTLGRCRGDVN